MMKRLIVYDLDGTLVDTGEDIAQAITHMLNTMHAAPLSLEEIRQYVGRGLHDLIRRCLKTDDPGSVARGTALFEAYYGQHMTDHSRLYPGAREVLEHFRGRRQAVFTNKPDPYARDLLTVLGVAGYFVDILAVGSAYPKKPDPTALHALMRADAVTPEQTLLIGDSTIDIDTGRRAGVLTVIIAQGFEDPQALRASKPDVVVQDFQEFLALARQQGW